MKAYKQAEGKNNRVNMPEGAKKLSAIMFPQYFSSSGVRMQIILKLAAFKVPNKTWSFSGINVVQGKLLYHTELNLQCVLISPKCLSCSNTGMDGYRWKWTRATAQHLFCYSTLLASKGASKIKRWLYKRLGMYGCFTGVLLRCDWITYEPGLDLQSRTLTE